MLRRDWVRIFAIRLAVVYVFLVLPWPKADSGFGAIYRGAVNVMLGSLRLESYLHLSEPPTHHPRGDVEIAAMNPQTGQRLRIEYGSRDWAFLPLAAGLALTLAVPPPWPGRVRSAFVLMGLIVLFIILRIAVASAYGLGTVGVFSISPASLKALGNFMLGFSATPIPSFVVPVILWLLVLYRSFDFGTAFRTDGQHSSQKAAGSAH